MRSRLLLLIFLFIIISLSGNASVIQDVVSGNFDNVKLAVEQDPSLLKAVDPKDGSTLLHWAAFEGHKDIVEYLIKLGATVDVRNSQGGSPLHCAAYNGKTDAIRLLLAAGAEPTLLDYNSATPLDYARQQGSSESINILSEAQQKIVKTLQGKEALPGCLWVDEIGWASMASDPVWVFVNSGVNGSPLSMSGVEFSHGCSVFLPRDFTIRLYGGARKIFLYLGVNDSGSPGEDSWNANITILVDNKTVFKSQTLKKGQFVGPISFDLTGVGIFKIIATGSGPLDIAGACIQMSDDERMASAAFKGDNATVDKILAASPAACNTRDRFFQLTPLQCAYYGAKYQLAASLVKQGAKASEVPSSLSESPDPCQMVFIPAGPFMMGANNGFPADRIPCANVDLPAYYIDTYEVTNAQFARFLNAAGKTSDSNNKWLRNTEDTHLVQSDGKWTAMPGFENYPIVNVTWYGASAYAAWAGKRLPTEAEWEKAARGLHRESSPWGGQPESGRGNLDNGDSKHYAPSSRGNSVVAVGGFPNGSSPYGCMDMIGNVSEWTNTLYRPYPYRNNDGREDPSATGMRVLRGSCYTDYDWLYWDIRNRIAQEPGYSSSSTGFRCIYTSQ